MTSTFQSARTALFCPGDKPERLRKALAGDAEVAILDLEDAVDPSAKDVARSNIADLLASPEVTAMVRINPPATREGEADLMMLREAAGRMPAGQMADRIAIVVPKAEAGPSLEAVASAVPGIALVGLIETSRGAMQAYEIASHPSVERLAVGAVDLSLELACEPDAGPIQWARSSVVIGSAAAGIVSPLDTPCLAITDTGIVADAATRAHRDGFGGMLCIHPGQLPIVEHAFQPADDDVAWAHRVVEAGDGASLVDGEMVDAPVVRRAERILQAVERSSRGRQ